MKIEATNLGSNSTVPLPKAADMVEDLRKKKEEVTQEPQVAKSNVAPEELLQQIKGLTDGGQYSVRFERDERANQLLVVKIVDRGTDEVIRQVPAEELLEISAILDGLRGNIINTDS